MKNCTWMLTAVLLIIIKPWKQPQYPPVDEHINCGTMNYHSMLKINNHQAMKRHGESLNAHCLSERSQSEKTTYGMIPTHRHYEKSKTRR